MIGLNTILLFCARWFFGCLTLAPVVVQIVPGVKRFDCVCDVVQSGEPIYAVRAEVRVEVLHIELAQTGPVHGPGAVVARGHVLRAAAACRPQVIYV